VVGGGGGGGGVVVVSGGSVVVVVEVVLVVVVDVVVDGVVFDVVTFAVGDESPPLKSTAEADTTPIAATRPVPTATRRTLTRIAHPSRCLPNAWEIGATNRRLERIRGFLGERLPEPLQASVSERLGCGG
jgi:hypothetical protein